jgi:hypothetical protein
MMMPKSSLFAEEERGSRHSKLGDPLVGIRKHVDFAVLADESIPLCRVCSAPKVAARRTQPP